MDQCDLVLTGAGREAKTTAATSFLIIVCGRACEFHVMILIRVTGWRGACHGRAVHGKRYASIAHWCSPSQTDGWGKESVNLRGAMSDGWTRCRSGPSNKSWSMVITVGHARTAGIERRRSRRRRTRKGEGPGMSA